jgi:cell division protein FtsL
MLLRSRFFAMLLFFFFGCVAFFYVWERISAVQLTIRIEKLKEDVASLENEVKRLEIRKTELSAHRRIESVAREKLGLRYPKQGEIVFVTKDEKCVSPIGKQDVQGKN